MKLISVLAALSTTVLASLPVRAMTDAQEIEMGAGVAQKVEDRFGGVLPDGDPLARRVQRLGAPFARLSSRRGIGYSYKVLKNDRVLNAFAAPGGRIYITRRLVNMAANDAELAAILGHETAHTDRRHIAATFEKFGRDQRAGTALGDKLLGKGKQGIGRSFISLGALIAFVVASPGYSRRHESEADALSARWMSRLGLDPRAEISILGKADRKAAVGEIERYWASHPAIRERNATLARLIAQENLLAVARENGGPRLWWSGRQASAKKRARRTRRHRRVVRKRRIAQVMGQKYA